MAHSQLLRLDDSGCRVQEERKLRVDIVYAQDLCRTLHRAAVEEAAAAAMAAASLGHPRVAVASRGSGQSGGFHDKQQR